MRPRTDNTIHFPLNNFGVKDYHFNKNRQWRNTYIPLMTIARPYYVDPKVFNYLYLDQVKEYSNIYGHTNPGYGMYEDRRYRNTIHNKNVGKWNTYNEYI